MTATVAELIERLKLCDPNAFVRARADFVNDSVYVPLDLVWDVAECTDHARGTKFVDIDVTSPAWKYIHRSKD